MSPNAPMLPCTWTGQLHDDRRVPVCAHVDARMDTLTGNASAAAPQPTRAVAAVVVPACNEATVIGRSLDALLEGNRNRMDLELVVVCNGCIDDTAAVARQHAPEARVLELETASKPVALNAGDAACTAFPRVYMDADVQLDYESLRKLIDAFDDPTLLCAAPEARFAVDACSWPVRKFYEVFTRLPYVTNDMVGTGVYALSTDGHERLGRFPTTTADDEHVRLLFKGIERRAVAGATFTVQPPRTVRHLIRVRQRVYRGNTELVRELGHAPRPTNSLGDVLGLARQSPASVFVYILINVVAKLRASFARRRPAAWERDTSTR